MVIYVDGLAEPQRLDRTMLITPELARLPSFDVIRAHFSHDQHTPVWLVPKQTCPECATRRNLADNPGA